MKQELIELPRLLRPAEIRAQSFERRRCGFGDMWGDRI
jgi:hypothetical protein